LDRRQKAWFFPSALVWGAYGASAALSAERTLVALFGGRHKATFAGGAQPARHAGELGGQAEIQISALGQPAMARRAVRRESLFRNSLTMACLSAPVTRNSGSATFDRRSGVTLIPSRPSGRCTAIASLPRACSRCEALNKD